MTRAKPDSVLYLSLMYLAKMKPNIFATEGVIEVRGARPAPSVPGVGRSAGALGRASLPPCGLPQACAASCEAGRLHRFKAKGNSLVSVLACNLLMAAACPGRDENTPEIFVKVKRLLPGERSW